MHLLLLIISALVLLYYSDRGGGIHIFSHDERWQYFRENLTCYLCDSEYVGDYCYVVTHLTRKYKFTVSDKMFCKPYCRRYTDKDGLVRRDALDFHYDDDVVKIFWFVYRDQTLDDLCYRNPLNPAKKEKLNDCVVCNTPLCNVGPYDDPDPRFIDLHNATAAAADEDWRGVLRGAQVLVTDFVKDALTRAKEAWKTLTGN